MLYLTSLDQRIELLKSLGVDIVVALTFDRELAQLSAREFVGLLREHLILCHLIVGPDFALGHRREGTIPVLNELGTEMGFTVESLSPFLDGDGDEERISSSAIRRALTERGDVTAAEQMLGRPHAVTGPVIRGYNRGKDLGFPTANVEVPAQRAVPADGVYVTRLYLDGAAYPSVTNVGDNPTFGNTERSVEVHILDFDRTIYDAEVRIEFLQRLRGEERFPSVGALVTQIGQDVEDARAYFR
jgi:riboflavin kinase/FMN adenylyltransferase